MQKATLIHGIILASIFTFSAQAEIIRAQHEDYTVWVDCERRGVVLFHYETEADTGNFQRSVEFSQDPIVPDRCEQTSTSSYKRPKGEQQYDKGHMVPANHFDSDQASIDDTMVLSNMLPHARNMNRTGAWKRTEVITECLRNDLAMDVWGGVFWGSKKSDDHFLDSHGIETPDYLWKALITEDKAIAWIIPNSDSSKWKKLDDMIVSLSKIEELAGVRFDVSDELKSQKPITSWKTPRGCDRS